VDQTEEHILQMLQPGTSGLLVTEVPDGLSQMGGGQKLHGHGGQLGGFGSWMPLPDQRQLVGRKGVERVSCLVQQSHHIVHQTHGVHEDEWPAVEVQRLTVSSGRLSLAALEIEQALIDHGLEFAPQGRVHPVEHPLRLDHQLARVGEWAERLFAVRIHREVPGTKHLEPEPLTAGLENPFDSRGNRQFHGLVETFAVGGSVVEAKLCRKDVVSEVGEAGVARGARPQLVHPVEESGHLLSLLDVRLA
jgi:hypothetical protein